MTHLHWMKTYIGDEAAATTHLTRDEFGGYELLRRYYWQHGCLPDDDGRLARIARASPDEWEKLKPVIKALFDDDWGNARLDEERAEAGDAHRRRVEAGRKGGKTKQSLSNARAKPKQPEPEPEPEPEPYSASEPTTDDWALEKGEAGKAKGLFSKFPRPPSTIQGRKLLLEQNVPIDKLDQYLPLLMAGTLSPFDIEQWTNKASIG
ncbi:YdaU family protein [Rhizobium leguminosarum]|uniref:YdaU family protein n=1 Tax=Rhizobium leguminosarum TaxID=384 RepID=UPI001C909329|nr:YdaU family protein [Rhizobium leguminosarum]MBY3030970.1 YdaU family protein [Rhizobium leguminosarum]